MKYSKKFVSDRRAGTCVIISDLLNAAKCIDMGRRVLLMRCGVRRCKVRRATTRFPIDLSGVELLCYSFLPFSFSSFATISRWSSHERRSSVLFLTRSVAFGQDNVMCLGVRQSLLQESLQDLTGFDKDLRPFDVQYQHARLGLHEGDEVTPHSRSDVTVAVQTQMMEVRLRHEHFHHQWHDGGPAEAVLINQENFKVG